MSKKTSAILKYTVLAVAIIAIIVLLWLMLDTGREPETIPYSGDQVQSLTSLIKNGDVRSIYIVNGSEAYVLLKNSQISYDAFKSNPTCNAD